MTDRTLRDQFAEAIRRGIAEYPLAEDDPRNEYELAADRVLELALPDMSKVTRVSVVGPEGRLYEGWNLFDHGTVLSLQDDGRTLKIFPAPSVDGQSRPSSDDTEADRRDLISPESHIAIEIATRQRRSSTDG